MQDYIVYLWVDDTTDTYKNKKEGLKTFTFIITPLFSIIYNIFDIPCTCTL
jgi:hypothetical protein